VNIINTIPGSPSSIDMDGNGLLDRVYVGDMDGNLFRVDVSLPWTTSSSWTASCLYTDADHYPIITTPALYTTSVGGISIPVVYFGTGGSDLAPTTATYSFIALDDGTTPTVEWYLGDASTLKLPSSKRVGGFEAGEKVWADPKIANYTVFFSTLTGNIESVNPCLSLAGEGKLYARFVQAFGGSAAGSSALKGSGGVIDYMELEIKSRSAVTLGDTETSASGSKKRQVFIHEFDSTIQKLEQPVGSTLKIKSWREVYKAVR
jgi:Tfp pilus tip-associated adhesin PilY1